GAVGESPHEVVEAHADVPSGCQLVAGGTDEVAAVVRGVHHAGLGVGQGPGIRVPLQAGAVDLTTGTVPGADGAVLRVVRDRDPQFDGLFLQRGVTEQFGSRNHVPARHLHCYTLVVHHSPGHRLQGI